MGGLNAMYPSIVMGAVILCVTSSVLGYPMIDSKDKFVQETDSHVDDKLSNDQLRKRIFDPIEAASNFGSFGKRYNPYRIWGLTKDHVGGQQGSGIAELMKRVLDMAVARQGKYVLDTPAQKRQFDKIGYGMFARFG